MGNRIYIVEDSLTMRAMLQSLVEEDEQLLVCGAAASAEQALEEIDAAKPDIFLLDLELRGMHGMDFLKRIESQVRDPWRPTRAIIVSSHTSAHASICDEVFALGATACFDKNLLSSCSADLLRLLHVVGTFEATQGTFEGGAVTMAPCAMEEEEEEKQEEEALGAAVEQDMIDDEPALDPIDRPRPDPSYSPIHRPALPEPSRIGIITYI